MGTSSSTTRSYIIGNINTHLERESRGILDLILPIVLERTRMLVIMMRFSGLRRR
eukprot:COSAG06_NODE_58923_length_275_cov_1.477273_1_plen_54_part_10